MAGLTDKGFVVKRLPEVITDKQATAVTLFQDLVAVGDIVDVSDSSTVGRLIGLDSISDANLWEAAQQIYSAFDANSATGISLDNMIAISGIPSRFQNTYTTAQVLLSGDNGTIIPVGNVVSSPTTKSQFNTLLDTSLSPVAASGITLVVNSVLDNTLYSASFLSSGITLTANYTSGTGATATSVLTGLSVSILTTVAGFTASLQNSDTFLVLTPNDVFIPTTFTTSSNLGIIKVSKLADIRAVTSGPLSQPINTINQIQTPLLGWDSVTNPIAAVSGRSRETDEELRLRFRNTKFERAGNIVEAVYSALFNLSDVQQVFIDDNNTSVVNENGTPPHSFLVLVDGGISSEIAKAIWDNRGGGVTSVGNTSVNIIDKFGYPRVVNFSRPIPVSLYITISITTNTDFPENGEDAIRKALVAYIDSLSIGQDIVYSRLYTPINSVPGHQVESLVIGKTASPTGTTNITIGFDEIGQVLPENIIFI